MTCRQTLTLDLVAFLDRPTAAEFAAFRAHYPRCAVCAAEVRTWTELHAALAGSSHPPAETLLRFQDGQLPTAGRRDLEQHLAACAPCRDELRALATFDATAHARQAAAAAPPPSRWRLPGFRLPELGRLVLHPALAYGLVLALLFYPSLSGRQTAPEPVAEPPAEAKKAAEPSADTSERVAMLRKDAPTPAPPATAAKQRSAEPARAPTPSAPAARARDAEAEADTDSASLRDELRGNGAATGIVAAARTRPLLETRDAGDTLVLRIPVRNELRAVGPLEVRVIDARGGRELRERVVPAGDWIEVNVPRVWLARGSYRVELRTLEARPEVDVFAFDASG